MDLVDPAVDAYLRDLQPSPDLLLQQMRLSGEKRGFPIIGPLVGRLCEQLARSIGDRRAFQLGSGCRRGSCFSASSSLA